MDLGLSNKKALVLGGGGGLGGAIAARLAREGAHVAVADINMEAALRTTSAIKGLGGRAQAFQWDLSKIDEIEAHVSRVGREVGEIDILVNNTGGPPPSLASGQSSETWIKYFESMVLSVFSVTDRILPGMRQRRWGRILTSTSSGVVAPIPNLGISNALRLSLVGWSKTLAREVGPEGVTVNVTVPGRIATGRINDLDRSKALREGRSVEAISAESTASIPLGRYGDPEEYAAAVAFLASVPASYITGSVMRVDGGLLQSI